MKRFEIQVSWTMTTSVEVEAQTGEEACRCVLAGMRPMDGSFVPFSMRVDSVDEGRREEPSKQLRRIK